jgi:fructose-specific phosphotransferase system IIB component
MKIVAVTACPTGIAHTYMAAEQLEKAAKFLGHQIKVETQGAMGIENELGKKEIRQAQVAIFAVDIRDRKARTFRAGQSDSRTCPRGNQEPDVGVQENPAVAGMSQGVPCRMDFM